MESSAGTSTPVKSSSISLSALASGKTLGSMDQRIIEEIHRTVFSGFDPALFIEKLYPLVDETRTTALIECQFDSQSRQWKSWPEKPTEQLVIGWLDQWTKQIATVFGVVQSRPRGSGDTPLRKHIPFVLISLAFVR